MMEKPGGSSAFFLSVGYGKGSLLNGLVETCGALLECLSFYVEKRKAKVVKRYKIPIDKIPLKPYGHVHMLVSMCTKFET